MLQDLASSATGVLMTSLNRVVIADRYQLDSELFARQLANSVTAESVRPHDLSGLDESQVHLLLIDAQLDEQTFAGLLARELSLGLLYDHDGPALRRRAAHPNVRLAVSRREDLQSLTDHVFAALTGLRYVSLPDHRPSAHGTMPTLSQRESEVLQLMAQGLGNRDIAEELRISPHTVRTHVQTVLAKLGRRSRVSAVGAARQAGLLAQ